MVGERAAIIAGRYARRSYRFGRVYMHRKMCLISAIQLSRIVELGLMPVISFFSFFPGALPKSKVWTDVFGGNIYLTVSALGSGVRIVIPVPISSGIYTNVFKYCRIYLHDGSMCVLRSRTRH